MQEGGPILIAFAPNKGRLFPSFCESVNEKWREGEFWFEGNLSTHKAKGKSNSEGNSGPLSFSTKRAL